MVQRSKISQLPEPVREWLDKALVAGNFSDYVLLSEELKKRGHDIGKSSIHREGQKLQRRLQAIKDSTAAAKAIVDSAPDDGDARSEAILGLVQTELFEAMIGLQDAAEAIDPVIRLKLLANVGKAVSSTSRASVHQKKYSTIVRERIQAATDESETIAKKAGMSDGDWALIRAKFLGIKVDNV